MALMIEVKFVYNEITSEVDFIGVGGLKIYVVEFVGGGKWLPVIEI